MNLDTQGLDVELTIPRRWRLAVKIAWAVLFAACTTVILAAALADYSFFTGLAVTFDWTETQYQVALQSLGWQTGSLDLLNLWADKILPGALYLSLSALIFLRSRDNRMAVFISVFLMIWAVSTTNSIDARESLPPLLSFMTYILWLAGVAVMIPLFYIFPDGRFYPRWTKWPTILAVILLILLLAEKLPESLAALIGIFVAAWMFSGIIFQVIRYRKASNAIQRQQTKVVVFGLASWVVLAGLVGWLLWAMVLPDIITGLDQKNSIRLVYEIIGMRVSGLGSLLLASSFAIAILRYHLYDIDLIIRRTLVYGALTVSLALLYFGLVTLMQALSSSVFGLRSPVVIVLSTLAIAALFNPLRRRIQDFIDRRFYRKKYDAEKALAQFAEAARNETDIKCLNEALLEVVQETMQPESASLWIQPQGRKR